MDLNAYLERIGIARPLEPDLQSLRRLHRAHLLAVPFEDFDVQLGRRIEIDIPSIYHKIVEKHRGGWCYEMNGIFGWALDELGFRVTRATGAVVRELRGDASVGNHLVLRVDLGGDVWLADVGFGDGPLEPTKVEPGDFTVHGFLYSLTRADGEWWRLRNHPLGGAPSFDFQLGPADETVLRAKCDWLQTSQESGFVQNVVCQRYTASGFLALRGKTLKSISGDQSTDRQLASADELASVLAGDFGLDLPEAAALWPKICARHDLLFGKPSAS